MQEDLPKDNPSSQWPEEVRMAYEQLKIPSIYDCVLANEKLSLEIRKQNRDIKAVVEGFQVFSAQLNSVLEILNEEIEYDEDEVYESSLVEYHKKDFTELDEEVFQQKQATLKNKAKDVLLELTDTLVDLSRSMRYSLNQLLEILPKKEEFAPSIPVWHKLAEAITQSVIESMDLARYKAITKLNELDIHPIEPQAGEVYLSQKHRVLEKMTGGKSGTIARVVRIGYEEDKQVLRLAEVVIYI